MGIPVFPAGTVAFVPDVFQLAHGGRLLAVQPVEEAVVDHLAILSGAPCIDPDGSANLLFVRSHDVHKVADGLCGVVALADVDVDPASAAFRQRTKRSRFDRPSDDYHDRTLYASESDLLPKAPSEKVRAWYVQVLLPVP